MKYELDSIPVWDALKAETECPFCLLESRSRANSVRFYLGASVMAPETRVIVNENGFSKTNWRVLSKDQNRLGLGLISHTRLRTLRNQIHKTTASLDKECVKTASKGLLENLLNGKKTLVEVAHRLCEEIENMDQSCLIEARVKADLARYYFTAIQLVQTDTDFRLAWETSKGVCLAHLPGLIRMACEELAPSPLGKFLLVLVGIQDKALERVENDVFSFTKLFDSTHSHTTTGETKEAVERAIQKMAGIFAEYQENTRKGPLMRGVTD